MQVVKVGVRMHEDQLAETSADKAAAHVTAHVYNSATTHSFDFGPPEETSMYRCGPFRGTPRTVFTNRDMAALFRNTLLLVTSACVAQTGHTLMHLVVLR